MLSLPLTSRTAVIPVLLVIMLLPAASAKGQGVAAPEKCAAAKLHAAAKLLKESVPATGRTACR